MDLMDAWHRWLARQPRTVVLTLIGVLTVVGLALALLATPFVGAVLAPTLGGLGGLVWVLAVDVAWTLLSPERQREWDVRHRFPLGKRRPFLVVAVLVWFALLLLTGAAGLPVLGAVTVMFLVTVARVWAATPAEQMEQEELFAEIVAEQAARPPWRDRWRRRRSDDASDADLEPGDEGIDGEDPVEADGSFVGEEQREGPRP